MRGQALDAPIGIVHITKTSGTNFKHTSRCPDVRCTTHHSATVGYYRTRGMPAIAMLRDPAERFVSQFNHARFGTERYKPCLSDAQASVFPNATAFAAALLRADRQDPQQRRVFRDARALRAPLCGWGSAHPIGGLQADWLGDDPLNASAVELVCYDAADAVSRWYRGLRALGSGGGRRRAS